MKAIGLDIGTTSICGILIDAESGELLTAKTKNSNSLLCGGRAYSMLKDFYYNVLKFACDFNENKVYDMMNRMVEGVDESSLVVDTRFAGTRNNKELCGSVSGITTGNFTPSQLTLAVLEGMAMELYTMYKAMKVSKIGIVGSGNGIRRNAALVRVLERLFDAKMRIPKHLEEAAAGAALYGLVSCGIFKNAKEARQLIEYI